MHFFIFQISCCQKVKIVMNFAPRNEQKAHVAELVDALDSGSSISNDVEVRVLSCALVDAA